MKDIRIAVAGSVNMDLVFRCPRLPLPGETLAGRSFDQVPGGKGANQAVAAARQGARVDMIGRVGADGFGAALRAALAADGIDLSCLQTDPDAASGVAAILVDDAGGNSIVVEGGANMRVRPADIDAATPAFDGIDALICQLEIPLDAVARAMDLARAAGAIVVFNPAPVQALPDSLLARVDYLVVNETEAEQLCGIAVDGAAAAIVAATKLRSRGAGAVLLTMGGRGVVLADAQGVAHYPALRVEAVDTTAAGDTFIGAFAVALLEGGDPAAACMRAQHAAALAVTRPGAQSSIPLRAEVDRFIAERRAGSD